MSYSVEALEPRVLWKYFSRICQIPHGSGNEAALGKAIVSWASEKGCETEVDDVGNIIVRIPATKGYESAAKVVLQGHLDMVCEKNADTDFDFEKDPIVPVCDGDWIRADGTSLGADNGIGVATGLSLMDMPQAVHGPIELLLTVEEESGLIGAQHLSTDSLRGRLLINMDSEKDGVFYIGCAGERDSLIELTLSRTAAANTHAGYHIQVKGLRGGHSGLDIIRNRGNGIRLLARALFAIQKETDMAIASIDGGDKHNAIPREAVALVAAEAGKEEMIRRVIDTQRAGFLAEFANEEPNLSLTVERLARPNDVFDPAITEKTLQLLLGLPNGVISLDRHLPGIVETSTNLARVRIVNKDKLEVMNSTRSAVKAAIDGVVVQIESVSAAVGAKVETDSGYPGWKPDMDSKLLAGARRIWEQVHGDEASLQVIHAGLECGIIGEKFEDMDMISIGPTILNAHSPNEQVSISTVVRFFDFFQAFLASLV
ncbi:MAG: aminoacyl-histidine dipeptidase [Proteobacteria bacterium]|nr:aminoacyl-histidine dipeptidase [Pseudomonadota bacterium]